MSIGKVRLTAEQLDEYAELTYLTKWEVLLILEKISSLVPEQTPFDLYSRIPNSQIAEVFPQLKFNPFRDQLFAVFSSSHDDRCSFEDVLDLFSVMSDRCPQQIKAAWAFRVFDLDNDNMITRDDICSICDRLSKNNQLRDDEKSCIADVVLQEMDLHNNGSLGEFDFIHAISKVTEFHNTFSFRP